LRLLWASNYPDAPTGYGGQTSQVVRRLRDAGHEVAVAANFGVQGREDDWEGVPVYPPSYDAYGNDVLPSHFADWAKDKPAYLFTLFDVWPYVRERFANLPVVSWVPIDHFPVPPNVAAWCGEHRTIAMSRYGEDQLRLQNIPSTYIPHAIERSVFYPRDREAEREERGWSDKFVVLINAANKGNNPIRKAWSEMFGALRVFLSRHDDAIAFVNSEIVGFQSPDLGLLATLWGLTPDRVVFTDQYQYKAFRQTPDWLARTYSAADVLLSTSMGEGFGIPVIEAQACGIPVIVTNFSAQPELVGGGWTVRSQLTYDVGQHAFMAVPDIGDIVARLELAYEARGDQTIRQQALDKAAEYDADTVWTESWVPYLAQLEDDLKPRIKRQERRRKAKRRAA